MPGTVRQPNPDRAALNIRKNRGSGQYPIVDIPRVEVCLLQKFQREIEIAWIAAGISLCRNIFGLHATFQVCAVGPNWDVGIPTQM